MPYRPDRWISRKRAAILLEVSEQTVSNYAAKGLIQSRGEGKHPVFYEPEVKALAANQEYKDARVLEKRITTYKRALQTEFYSVEKERKERIKEFLGEYGTERGQMRVFKLERIAEMLACIISDAKISERHKDVLRMVLEFKSPREIVEKLQLPQSYIQGFRAPFVTALKNLTWFYRLQDSSLRSKEETIEVLESKYRAAEKEIDELRKMVHDQQVLERIKREKDDLTEIGEILARYPPFNVKLDDYGISVRARNCLTTAGVRTVGDLTQRSRKDFLLLRNLGQKVMKEIDIILERNDLSYAMDIDSIRDYLDKTHDLRLKPLSSCGLSQSALTKLGSHGFETIGSLCEVTKEKLLAKPGLGGKTVDEAEELLKKYGFKFKKER